MQGVPIKLLGANNDMQRLAQQSTNDNVLVILQLRGGNDGLNTFIPVANYDDYEDVRPNIAIPRRGTRQMIPLDSTVASADQVAVHPDMQHFKELYDMGKAAVYQGVSYENHTGSHFRGTDIMFMGGESDEYLDSGWVGRYLGKEYEPLSYPVDFPTEEMPDPLALELGRDASLIFHQKDKITTAISLADTPSVLNKLIEGLDGFSDQDGVDSRGNPPRFLDDTAYADHLKFLLEVEDKSQKYAKRLEEIYSTVSESSVTYPETYPYTTDPGSRNNELSEQLKLIAELLGAGLKTKVFLVKVTGFDTHANQVEDDDPTMGTHAALLYHLSSAMHAFQADLQERGLEDRVLTVSLSEFGRRVRSNGSFGSDHGRGGPIMLFGKGVNPGIFGTVPDLTQKNVDMQFDYRQIYASALREWMGVSKTVLTNDIFFRDFIDGNNPAGGSYEPLDLIKGADVVSSDKDYVRKNYHIDSVYPNPASKYTQTNIFVNNYQNIRVRLINMQGKTIAQLNRSVAPGTHNFTFLLNGVKPGIYFVKATSEMLDDVKRIVVIK